MADIPNHGTGPAPNMYLDLHRRLYTHDLINREYKDLAVTPSVRDRVKKACTCSTSGALRILYSFLPIIGVVRHYTWKKDTISDFMAGLTVSFMQVPQGLAMGLLASLPPVFGLYTSLYPVLIYVIFGTSRHISMGTNALLALLTAGIVERELQLYIEKGQPASSTLESEMFNDTLDMESITEATTSATLSLSLAEQNAYKVGVASSVAFISGAMLLTMGVFKVGFLTSYLSASFVGGFTTAAAFHIGTSQISKLFHIRVPPHTGAGKIVKTYIDIFKSIEDSNPADVIVSVISFVFLLGITIFVNERYRAKLRLPIPVDLIIVIVSTIISHYARLEQNFDIAIVGDIPLGLPSPAIPETDVLGRILVDSIVIAVLTFTLSIALAKLMSETHGYPIDPDQELVAYGLCNVLGSFFRCFASCTAPPRTMTLHNIGTKSTLNGIVTAFVILLIILAAGQLFTSLPVAVLAAMIIVAVKNLLMQVRELPDLWRVSKVDFFVWLVTCLVSVFLDLDYGIGIGVGMSIITVIVRNQIVSGQVGALSNREDLVLYGEKREGVEHDTHFRIFYFPSQLIFANADRFTNELFSKTLNPLRLEPVTTLTKENGEGHSQRNTSNPGNEKRHEDGDVRVKCVILDCSAITYIDLAGVNAMKRIATQYQRVGVDLMLTRCPPDTLTALDRAGYFQIKNRDTVFWDIYDAVTFCNAIYRSD